MEHLAIMKKSWKLTNKILSGEKKIESRWYKSRRLPWDKIKAGETVYFKDAGEPVCLRAQVRRVMQFSSLSPDKVGQILNKYAKDDGIEKEEIATFFELFRDKKYCILVFLRNPQKLKPFQIDKTGFGTMSAWLTLDNISKIKQNK